MIEFKGKIFIEQFPGKGGWHYAVVPIESLKTNSAFGWLEVNCIVDGLDLGLIKLMPMGNQKLFLPLKKALRKQLNKELGDPIAVHVYYIAPSPPSQNFLDESIKMASPEGYERYKTLSKTEQDRLINWILSTNFESKQIEKIAQLIAFLEEKRDTKKLK